MLFYPFPHSDSNIEMQQGTKRSFYRMSRTLFRELPSPGFYFPFILQIIQTQSKTLEILKHKVSIDFFNFAMAKCSKKIEFDPYKVLQLENGCEPGQIDKAYKKQALRWHPDKNPDNPEKAQTMFLRVYEAYEFLKNEQARAEYDENIAAKRRKADFEAERQSVSSEQRKAHLTKLKEAEAKAARASQKRKREQSARDELIEELRQEGQRMMQRVREEEQKRKHRAQQTQQHDAQRTAATTTGPPSRQLREEVDELEKALFGGTVL